MRQYSIQCSEERGNCYNWHFMSYCKGQTIKCVLNFNFVFFLIKILLFFIFVSLICSRSAKVYNPHLHTLANLQNNLWNWKICMNIYWQLFVLTDPQPTDGFHTEIGIICINNTAQQLHEFVNKKSYTFLKRFPLDKYDCGIHSTRPTE